jgi:uncharacterized membrane protein
MYSLEVSIKINWFEVELVSILALEKIGIKNIHIKIIKNNMKEKILLIKITLHLLVYQYLSGEVGKICFPSDGNLGAIIGNLVQEIVEFFHERYFPS